MLDEGPSETHGVGDALGVALGVAPGEGEADAEGDAEAEGVGLSPGHGGGAGRRPAETMMVTVVDCNACEPATGDWPTTVPTGLFEYWANGATWNPVF